MSRKLPFFKFDAESWLSGKIHILPVEEIGIYINLIALIWRDGGKIKKDRFIHRFLGVEKEVWDEALSDFKDLEIIYEDGGFLRIKFIDEQLQAREEFIAGCSAGGKNSAKAKKQTEVRSSDPEDTLKVTASDLEGAGKVEASNKKEERREKREEQEKDLVLSDDKSSSSTSPKRQQAVTFGYETDAKIHGITPDMLEYWRQQFPAVDIEQEIRSAEVWLDSNRTQRKHDIKRFLSNWLTRTQERSRKPPSQWSPQQQPYRKFDGNIPKPVIEEEREAFDGF